MTIIAPITAATTVRGDLLTEKAAVWSRCGELHYAMTIGDPYAIHEVTPMIAAKWDITSRCNLRCRHCSVASTYFSRQPYTELDLPKKLAVLSNLADGGVTYLSLLGGEPLSLHEDLLILISHAKNKGMNVGIVTNGILLTKDVCLRLIDTGVDRITVSIESIHSAQHDEIRGRGTHKKLLSNLAGFIEARGARSFPKLSVNSVLTQVNKADFIDIARLCQSIGADEWTALTLNYVGNAHKNLGSLVLKPEEHTEVALDLARQLPSFSQAGHDFKVNIQLIYPIVWEYMATKYGIRPPWPQICCSAARSLVYVAPNGEMHLCDRVHASVYSAAKISDQEIRPVDLVAGSFSNGWATRLFDEMFSFVKNPETYKNYIPCRRCKYLAAGLCEPCPLYSLEGPNITFPQCIEAENFLGDIGGAIDWDQIPAEEQRGRYEKNPSADGYDSDHESDALKVLSRVSGVRYFRYANGDGVIFNPTTRATLKLNPMANVIFEAVDGRRKRAEIINHAAELYVSAAEAIGKHRPTEAAVGKMRVQANALLVQMQTEGYVALALTDTRA
jgi:MoaA/NifB/PqqE/SkfB family radical SAM enzyme